jgi:hypothetical protein
MKFQAALRCAPRSHPLSLTILSPPPISRDYVKSNISSPTAMGRVGRPFEGRKREAGRRQARIDKKTAGPKEQIRYTINVRKNSREWQLLNPQENRSEFIRECVREYPTLLRQVRKYSDAIDDLSTQVDNWRLRFRKLAEANAELTHAAGLCRPKFCHVCLMEEFK